jgi:hypothetical protein
MQIRQADGSLTNLPGLCILFNDVRGRKITLLIAQGFLLTFA